jgi:nucleoside triphosphate pyrophosphatase
MMMPLWRAAQPLVLASRSAPRRAMLEAAGLPVEISLPDLDERAVEAAAGPLGPAEAAMLLAREKAKAVALHRPGRLVVGADQTLALGHRRFDKPHDRAAARAQLMALSGNTHQLHSAVAVVRGDEVLLAAVDTASLTMRTLSDSFLDAYFDAAGTAVLESVGAYQLEKLGIHLFERIEGDHFTILGLPLLALIAFLRRDGYLVG